MFLKGRAEKRGRTGEGSAVRMLYADVQTLAGLHMQNVQRARTLARGACWDKFKLVDLSDNHRATLINAGLLFLSLPLCACAVNHYI